MELSIEMLQNSSPRELEDLGISEQDAAAVITAFEEALLERSLLPDSELRAYGNTLASLSMISARKTPPTSLTPAHRLLCRPS